MQTDSVSVSVFLDAGNVLLNDPDEYYRIARSCAKGIEYKGIEYDCVL
jgi:hypothetical protein